MTRGEKTAAYMAHGYDRPSGTPGICMAQTVGDASRPVGLRDEYLASSPVIAGGPQPETKYPPGGRGLSLVH
jgi:acetolactate synthase-1/2/3 large subunit